MVINLFEIIVICILVILVKLILTSIDVAKYKSIHNIIQKLSTVNQKTEKRKKVK